MDQSRAIDAQGGCTKDNDHRDPCAQGPKRIFYSFFQSLFKQLSKTILASHDRSDAPEVKDDQEQENQNPVDDAMAQDRKESGTEKRQPECNIKTCDCEEIKNETA